MPEITEVEEKIAAVETEIVRLKGGRDWRSLDGEDRDRLKRLEEEKNILLQQQLLLLSATAGNTYSSSHALPLEIFILNASYCTPLTFSLLTEIWLL